MGKVIMSGIVPQLKEPSNLPPKGKALNDYTWEEIRMISDAGAASEYFNVGDCKEIALNGTVGKLALSNYSTNVFIIGIDHNAELEGGNRIHFQLAKTSLGNHVALCDSVYSKSGTAANEFRINTSSTSTGGWKSTHMRSNILGTSLTSYAGTIVGVIPENLRAVIKPVTKYTNNVGQTTDASAVTETIEYFFLLSEYEVFGTTSRASQNEASKQKQYDYYSAGNTKVKNNHSSANTAVRWWLRSPCASYANSFVYVRESGTVDYAQPVYSYGVSPAFCV